MTPEVILSALRRSGATFLDEADGPSPGAVTRQDLYRLGLMGGPDSAALRNRVKHALGLPAHLGTSGFLEAVNLITDLEGMEQLLIKESRDHL